MRLFILLANCVMKQEHDHWLINWLPQKLYSEKDQTEIQVKFIPDFIIILIYQPTDSSFLRQNVSDPR